VTAWVDRAVLTLTVRIGLRWRIDPRPFRHCVAVMGIHVDDPDHGAVAGRAGGTLRHLAVADPDARAAGLSRSAARAAAKGAGDPHRRVGGADAATAGYSLGGPMANETDGIPPAFTGSGMFSTTPCVDRWSALM